MIMIIIMIIAIMMIIIMIVIIMIIIIALNGPTFKPDLQDLKKKNAPKRSRQYAGEKYREYPQHRVCFVNKQVPCPTPI